MKKSWILPFFLMLFLPIIAFAKGMSYPLAGELIVTSEYGWRMHPIFGTQKYHSGIDFGADYGQDVYAAAPGSVKLADWYNGYGYAIIIDHGNGVETLYGHNQTLIVYPGQVVGQGEVIAYAGSTGNSTGPHCHFEVMQNGETVDPAPFLDGSLPVSDGEFMDFFKSDYNVIPLNFDSHFDFAKPMREAMETFAKTCATGMGYLKDEVMWLFIALSTIDLALAAMWRLFSQSGDDTAKFLLRKCLTYGFLIFIIREWNEIANAIRQYFSYMGAVSAGSTLEEAGKIISDPTMIVQKGVHLVTPFFNYAGTFSGMQILYNIGTVQMVLLMGFLILGCWFLIGFQIAMAYIEFYVIGMFSIVAMSFAGLKHTKQFAGQGFNSLIQVSLKLMFYCMFAVLLTNTMENLTVDDYFTSERTQGSYGMNGIDQFMDAVGQRESRGSGGYDAVNSVTGAMGKYQIMPNNWPVWAAEAGLSPDAPMSPDNQDLVARYKMLQYYEEFGNWRAVAVAWNGGEGAVGNDVRDAENYADEVMQEVGQAIDKSFNLFLALKLFLASLLFVFLGNRVSKTILKIFAGGGVRF